MQDNKTELSVSTEVLEKMAEIAAQEIEGVSGLSKTAIDIKNALSMKGAFKGVKIDDVNGAVNINVSLVLKPDVNAREVAEAVQKNVKDKIQTMTGTVVTKVNVSVEDIDTETAKKQ